MVEIDYKARYEEARQVLEEWQGKKGHNRCWYYPELFNKLRGIFNVERSSQPELPPLEEFREGCRRYQAEEYGEE